MLNSKFDLYKSGWLELVFDNRNKSYGAYALRQQYAGNMMRAMGITFLGIALLFGAGMILRPKVVPTAPPLPDDRIIHVVNLHPVDPVAPKAKPKTVKPPVAPKTVQNLPMAVKPDKDAKQPVKNVDLQDVVIGPVNTNGKPGVGPPPDITIDDGPGTQPAPPDTKVYPPIGLQSMPEPIGGDKAWAKFLNKNLRFPPSAQEVGASGRVILVFIIEKDGTLSNITVDRPAGNGFDEEALRVLKLAKAWKPGIQNGQPVRVRFEIPINFQYTGDN